MLRSHSFLGVCLLAIAGAVTGCGDDGDGGMDAGSHDGHPHEDAGGFTAVPCGDVEQLFSGAVAKGEDGNYQVKVIETKPAPPDKGEGDWVVEIQDSKGKAIEDVEIVAVKPFMPAHNHGGIIVPGFVALAATGRYQIGGMDSEGNQLGGINLWMSGPWDVTFELDGLDGEDEAVFEVCVKE